MKRKQVGDTPTCFFARDNQSFAYTVIKEAEYMCRRTILIGSAMIAAGIGVLLSVLFDSVFLRVLIGFALAAAGFLFISSRR